MTTWRGECLRWDAVCRAARRSDAYARGRGAGARNFFLFALLFVGATDGRSAVAGAGRVRADDGAGQTCFLTGCS